MPNRRPIPAAYPYVRRSTLAGDLTPRRRALWDQHTRHLVALDPARGPSLVPGTVGGEYFLEVPEHLLPEWERWPARRPLWSTENTLFVDSVPLAQPQRAAVAVAARVGPEADPGAVLAGDVCPVCGRPDPTGAYLEGVRDTKIALGLEEPDSDVDEINS